MNTAAKLFIEQRKDEYREIGYVEKVGHVNFYTRKSIFPGDKEEMRIEIMPLSKKKPRKNVFELQRKFGAFSLLVSTLGCSEWNEKIRNLKKSRKNFRLIYPDGETHTLNCIAISPGGREPFLHIQLHICAAPLIENRSAATDKELQDHLSDLNSP